jgi:hypothetical protein
VLPTLPTSAAPRLACLTYNKKQERHLLDPPECRRDGRLSSGKAWLASSESAPGVDCANAGSAAAAGFFDVNEVLQVIDHSRPSGSGHLDHR